MFSLATPFRSAAARPLVPTPAMLSFSLGDLKLGRVMQAGSPAASAPAARAEV
jgi:hypothetical protein